MPFHASLGSCFLFAPLLSGSSRPATATISATHITSLHLPHQSPFSSSSRAPPDLAKTRSPVSNTLHLVFASLPDISRPTDHHQPKTDANGSGPTSRPSPGRSVWASSWDGHEIFAVIFSERLWLRKVGKEVNHGQPQQAASMAVRLGPTKSSADSLALHHMFSLPLELGIVGHTQVAIIS